MCGVRSKLPGLGKELEASWDAGTTASSQSPARAVVPIALLPGRALAGYREEGLSKTVGGGKRLFGSQQLLLSTESLIESQPCWLLQGLFQPRRT